MTQESQELMSLSSVIAQHCVDGVRESTKRPGHMLYGCEGSYNYTLVRDTISNVISEFGLYHIGSPPDRRIALDELVADFVHYATMSDFDFGRATTICGMAGKITITHIESFREAHSSAIHRFQSGRPKNEWSVKKFLVEAAKMIIFMQVYSFLADRYLDADGNWR